MLVIWIDEGRWLVMFYAQWICCQLKSYITTCSCSLNYWSWVYSCTRSFKRSFMAQRAGIWVVDIQKSVLIFCDSSSAIHLCKNPAHREKTKHIDIKLHFIRNEISEAAVKMVKIHTLQTCLPKLFRLLSSSYACPGLAGLSNLWNYLMLEKEHEWAVLI